MGKNKKKYDLASRQEKILKRMAKPLYNKSDNSAYLVITQPFGMHPNPAERGPVDVNRLSSWISWVFKRHSVVETVYAMSTVSRTVTRFASFPELPSEGRSHRQDRRRGPPSCHTREAQIQEHPQRGLALGSKSRILRLHIQLPE